MVKFSKGFVIKENLISTYKKFPHLNTQSLIEYHAVFSGLQTDEKILYCKDIFEAIRIEILEKYEILKDKFIYFEDDILQNFSEIFLIKLANGDRKFFTILQNTQIPRIKGNQIHNTLLSLNIIKTELSREKPFKTKKQKIKKHLRSYRIENKLHFTQGFYRFWYSFIAPNLDLIYQKEYDKLLKIIQDSFDKFVSLCFENLGYELVLKILNEEKKLEFASFWKRNIELDILFFTEEKKLIIGEVKYKDTRVCKNVINIINSKCKKLNLTPDKVILISKSGFSKELKMLENESLILLELDDFKRLYCDR